MATSPGSEAGRSAKISAAPHTIQNFSRWYWIDNASFGLSKEEVTLVFHVGIDCLVDDRPASFVRSLSSTLLPRQITSRCRREMILHRCSFSTPVERSQRCASSSAQQGHEPHACRTTPPSHGTQLPPLYAENVSIPETQT
jgi:hypothetical protein